MAWNVCVVLYGIVCILESYTKNNVRKLIDKHINIRKCLHVYGCSMDGLVLYGNTHYLLPPQA